MGILNWLTGGELEANRDKIDDQREKIAQLRSIIADNNVTIARKSAAFSDANDKIVKDLKTISKLTKRCRILENAHKAIVAAKTPGANGTVKKIIRLSSDALGHVEERYEPVQVKS